MRMKLRIDSINPQHVHLSIFSDNSFENNGTFAHLGKLIMTIGEYQHFGCALGLGAGQMKGRLVLMPEDPKFKEWAEKEAKKEQEICGFCKHYNPDDNYCSARGEFEIYEEDTCDGWEEED